MKDAKSRVDVGRLSAKGTVIPFERDAGFYLQKGMFYYQKNKPDKALRFFQKAVSVEPRSPFNHYNLACMLSKLGRLKEANRIFLHIIHELDDSIADCYFLLAINYGLLEDLEKSREYLMHYLQVDPDGEMSFEALELLDAIDEDVVFDQLPAYSERDLFMERILKAGSTDELGQLYTSNKGFRKALKNRLYHGSDEFKEEILRFYGVLGGESARRVLREFVKNPWIKERFRQLALLELQKLGDQEEVQIFQNGKVKEMSLESYPIKTPVWRSEWQRVIDRVMDNMRSSNCYEDGFFDDVQAIWQDFINTVYPNTPNISKIGTWAAALEYCLARFHFLDLTQKELADEYGVSAASVSGKFREINRVLRIDEKAYRNMITYLKSEY